MYDPLLRGSGIKHISRNLELFVLFSNPERNEKLTRAKTLA
jgi:hypothetical protein